MWRVSRYEFVVSMVAFAAVLMLGILKGVMVAVLVSLLLLIRRAAHPHVAFLGRIPGTRGFSDMSAIPTTRPCRARWCSASRRRCSTSTSSTCAMPSGRRSALPPSAEAGRVRSVHITGRRPGRRAHAGELARGTPGVRDTPAARRAHATVRDILRAEGLEETVGYFGRRISVADVIDEFQGKTVTGGLPDRPDSASTPRTSKRCSSRSRSWAPFRLGMGPSRSETQAAFSHLPMLLLKAMRHPPVAVMAARAEITDAAMGSRAECVMLQTRGLISARRCGYSGGARAG